MSEKVRLEYMVVPEKLSELAYVPDAVTIKIVDSKSIFLGAILGESGRRLVDSGVEFYFTRKLAYDLIDRKIAVLVDDNPGLTLMASDPPPALGGQLSGKGYVEDKEITADDLYKIIFGKDKSYAGLPTASQKSWDNRLVRLKKQLNGEHW